MRIDIILHCVNIYLMFIPRYVERCQSNSAELSVYRERSGITSDTFYLSNAILTHRKASSSGVTGGRRADIE